MKFICQCIFPLLLHLIVKLTFMKQLKKKKKKKETNPLCISHAQRVIFTCLKRELKNYYKRYRVYSYLIPARDNQIKNYAFLPPFPTTPLPTFQNEICCNRVGANRFLKKRPSLFFNVMIVTSVAKFFIPFLYFN